MPRGKLNTDFNTIGLSFLSEASSVRDRQMGKTRNATYAISRIYGRTIAYTYWQCWWSV